jgi:hypothetical protein
MVVHSPFDATSEHLTTFRYAEDPGLERKDRFQRVGVAEGKPQGNDAPGASSQNHYVAQIETGDQGGGVVSVPS